MTELQCDVTHCANNSGSRCCRPDINVSGPAACGNDQTCCSNFICEDESPSNSISSSNSCACHAPNETLEVGCNAKNCAHYASNGKCGAEHIQVGNCEAGGTTDDKGQTKCATFKMK